MSSHYTTELQMNPTAVDVSWLEDQLRTYNRSQVANPVRLEFLITLTDRETNLVGGVFAKVSYGWLFIDALWIAEAIRGKGEGRKLLHRAEEQALQHGCQNAWVDTFSFQARGFYERHGYVIFGDLPDYPPGHMRYFMRKRLV